MGKYAVHRSDANAKAIYGAARGLGFSVWPIHSPVDSLWGKFGLTVAVEVKTPTGKVRAGQQKKFLREFEGAVYLIRSVEDVIALEQRLRKIAERLR